MEKIFQRTHYNQLLMGFCDVDDTRDWSVEFTKTGFSSNFDGGRNIHNPSDFCVIYAELDVPAGGNFCEDNMIPASLFMLKRHESYRQDPNDWDREIYLQLPEPEKITEKEINNEDFWWWGIFGKIKKEEEIPSEVVSCLKKGLEMMKNLYGQGNHDGFWGKKIRKNKEPIVEVID